MNFPCLRAIPKPGALFLPLLLLVISGATSALADDPIPKPLPASRYDKLAANSPFSPPTAVNLPPSTPPPPAPPGFADKYTLASIMQQGDDYFATLNNKEGSDRVRVSKNKANEEGLKIASVAWGSVSTPTRVTLEKNQQFGEVSFDPNASPVPSATSPGAIPGAMAQRPNLRPVPPLPNGIRPGPGAATGSRPIIPAGMAPNPNATRRPGMIRGPGAQITPRPNNPGVNFQRQSPIPGIKPASDDDDDDDE